MLGVFGAALRCVQCYGATGERALETDLLGIHRPVLVVAGLAASIREVDDRAQSWRTDGDA